MPEWTSELHRISGCYVTLVLLCAPAWPSDPHFWVAVSVRCSTLVLPQLSCAGVVSVWGEWFVLVGPQIERSYTQGLHLRAPGSPRGKEPACRCSGCKRRRFRPWVRKVPWRRMWQPPRVLAWRSWTEEPAGLQSMGLKWLSTRQPYWHLGLI